MSLLLRGRRAGVLVFLGLSTAAAIAAPAGCLFPEYTFNEPEPTTTGGSTENCTNGVDDDGNGAVDCADPGCGSYACVPELPAGWAGYFALYDGPPAGDPGCPAEFPSTTTPAFQGNDGMTATDAECACECEAPTYTGCATLDSIAITTGDAPCGQAGVCSGGMDTVAGWTGACETGQGVFIGGQTTCGTGASNQCDTQTGNPCNVSVKSTALAALGGQCQATPTVTLPPPTWERFGRACADAPTSGAGCNIGQVCLPRLQAPYESGVCVMMAGDNVCPPGAFTEKHVFFDDVMDTRACTDCTCGQASGGTCPTTISIYSDTQTDTCVTLVTSFAAGTCADVAGNPTFGGRMATAPGAPTGGSCPPSSPTPTGDVTPTNPTTFCCIP